MSSLINDEDIVVLILSTRDPRYNVFIDALENSWVGELERRNIKCFFYSGGCSKNNIVGNKIYLTAKDDLRNTYDKFLSALSMVVSLFPNAKIVYRTNLSSYIDSEIFLRFICEQKLDKFSYAGIQGKTTYIREVMYQIPLINKLSSFCKVGRRISFASGSGFFLGIEHAKTLLVNSEGYQMKLIDDVMVANVLGLKPNVNCVPSRFDISEDGSHKVSSQVYEKLCNQGCLFHYRFKTKNRNYDAGLIEHFRDKNFRIEFCTL